MLRKRNIVESTTPPSTDSLWLNKGIAKVFINGKWVTIAGEESPDQKELEDKVDNLDKEVGQIKKELKDYTYTLPAATKTTLGGIKAGTNIVNISKE